MGVIKVLYKFVLSVLFLALTPYYNCLIYDFEEGIPFSGNQFYNPYTEQTKERALANFHAHTIAHYGLTEGGNSTDEMIGKYNAMGYHVPAITNYNDISPDPGNVAIYLPSYEHGANFRANHQLVLNAEESTWFDYTLWPFMSHRQHMLNQLKTDDNLIGYAHPNFNDKMVAEDFSYFSNYDLMEIISARANSFEHWDAALSCGHAVWGITNDDAHDTIPNECGLCWNWLNVDQMDKASVMKSLSSGNFYGNKGWEANDVNVLKSIQVKNGIYEIHLKHKTDSITLIGDHGKILKVGKGVKSLKYEIQPEDTYVRAEAITTDGEWRGWIRQWFNPVIRYDGAFKKHTTDNQVNWLKTMGYWLLLVLIQVLLFKSIRGKKQQ